MPHIRLQPDIQCHPTWSGSVNVNPEKLPISEELKQAIGAWGKNFESATNQGQTGFSSSKEEATFNKQGEHLREALRTELGNGYKIS